MVLSRPDLGPSLIHQGQRNAQHGVAHTNICVMNEGRCLPSLFRGSQPARKEGLWAEVRVTLGSLSQLSLIPWQG